MGFGIQAQKTGIPSGIDVECLGNLMRLSLDKSVLSGHQLDIDVDDETFDLALRLRLSGSPTSAAATHTVTGTCSYTEWASREIMCTKNFMEVSVRRRVPAVIPTEEEDFDFKSLEYDEEPESSPLHIWKIQFHSAAEKTMSVEETNDLGYGLTASLNRLCLRSCYNTTETVTMDVAGVPMRVIKASTFVKRRWMVKQLETSAACPIGGVTFTDKMITWKLPLHIHPLLSSSSFNLLEHYMGIDGKRLDASTMAARKYRMTVTDTYIIVEIPVGSIDGFYKSHSPDYQYYVTYSIEPMLEVHWREDSMYDDTLYKVLFPITTPPTARPPFILDHTHPEQMVFDFFVGSFLYDVVLVNITFETGVLSVAEANDRGFNVQRHLSVNGSVGFSLQVPFSDPVVRKWNAPFSHSGVLQAYRQEIVLPTITGTCDREYFHVTVAYGNQGHNFVTIVGQRELTAAVAEEYQLVQNDTHFSIAAHFLVQDAIFEMVWTNLVRSRLDVILKDPVNNWNLNDFSISCSFPMTMTECFPNGTMTALAVKVEAVPDLQPSQLTLRDSRCKPVYSDNIFAYFSFEVNSCGTTRKFVDSDMIYENEVSLGSKKISTAADQYLLMVSCHYRINDTFLLSFSTKPNPDIHVDSATGVLEVRMQLAQDSSYGIFYKDDQYPVVKYLREPLYFEVELMQSTDPQVELFLDNCWATYEQERTSLPKWDLIVDSCENPADPYQITFHPVYADERVHFRSHFKRFEVRMFSFTAENVPLKGQIFVHCDVVICDTNSPKDGLCSGFCYHKQNMATKDKAKKARRSIENHQQPRRSVSSGQIIVQ
ncbi:hypothetical protein AGOR_G00082200 [Albula goreensis]|uniref:ZP domain-containing protein n=1 Tax=Albula goreensis TaxID=1534307 RepID=A0A8T3DIJ6_9TELE|nr:hypothetical protein AGOR_G00082200 [Albula goreensis]